MKILMAVLIILLLLMVLSVWILVRFKKGKQKAQTEWQETAVDKIKGIGTTRSLDVIPLIDWYSGQENLKVEPGVSYLVKTDRNTILFDIGLNMARSDPSPLMHNMGQMGIGINDIDAIVISHNHADHVGGLKWSRAKTFSLGASQIDLSGKKVFTPIPMHYPGLVPVFSKDPTIIGRGVATTGTISNQLFLLGWTQEQALAVNVENKGIVLIVGCGHQTLPKILKRLEALFEEPLYGIIGGLHYPVTESRAKVIGINAQKYIGTGKPPWSPITLDEVKANIDVLRSRKPRIVSLSGHDSCDLVISEFKTAFGDAYEELKVGRRISIGGN